MIFLLVLLHIVDYLEFSNITYIYIAKNNSTQEVFFIIIFVIFLYIYIYIFLIKAMILKTLI